MNDANRFPVRVRFNWGFHDAQHDLESKRPARSMANHFDRPYAKGYEAGRAEFAQTGKRNESSEQAWIARCTCKVAFGWHSDGCRAKAA